MHREGFGRIVPKPLRKLADVHAAGVIEVLARGKQLYALGSRASKNIEQARMQAMIEEDV
jgi:uncharacterized membrane protein